MQSISGAHLHLLDDSCLSCVRCTYVEVGQSVESSKIHNTLITNVVAHSIIIDLLIFKS